jgi:hypothetical protein
LQQQQLEAEAILHPPSPTQQSAAATATLAADVERQRQEMQRQWRQQAALAARGAEAPPAPDGPQPRHPQSPHLHPQSPHLQPQPPHAQLPRMAPPPRQPQQHAPQHGSQHAPPAQPNQTLQTQQRQRTRPTHEPQPPAPQYLHPPALATERVGTTGRPAQPPLHERGAHQHGQAPLAVPHLYIQPTSGSVAQATHPPQPQRAPGMPPSGMPPHPSMLPSPDRLGGRSHNSAPTLATDPWASQPAGQQAGSAAAATWHPLGIGASPLAATALGGMDPWGGAGVFSAAVPGRLAPPPQPEAQPTQQASYGPSPFDMSHLRQHHLSGFDSHGVWK